jgi:hypothetical protein
LLALGRPLLARSHFSLVPDVIACVFAISSSINYSIGEAVIQATTLLLPIEGGLQEAARQQFRMTGQGGRSPHPEYITTVAVCNAIAEYAWRNDLAGRLQVRAEERTEMVYHSSFLATLLASRKPWKAMRLAARLESSRKGNVDITLLASVGVDTAFGVIETKGTLHFTQADVLTVNSRDEFSKDVLRNLEFLRAARWQGGVEFTAFTFFLRDDVSVLVTDGNAFCHRMMDYFASLTSQFLAHAAEFKFKVIVATADSSLHASDAEARATDELGMPAYEVSERWHIAYGIVAIWQEAKYIESDADAYAQQSLF